MNAGIGELPLLCNRLGTDRPQICEEIFARIVVVRVMPHIGREVEHPICPNNVSERRSDVEGLNLVPLIGIANITDDWSRP